MADAVWHGLQGPILLQWLPTSPAYDADKNHAFAFDLDLDRIRNWLIKF